MREIRNQIATKKRMIGIFLMIMLLVSTECEVKTNDLELAIGFKHLGHEARPRAYWNWLNGALTLNGLTRDLEKAKDKGLAGLEIWDTDNYQVGSQYGTIYLLFFF